MLSKIRFVLIEGLGFELVFESESVFFRSVKRNLNSQNISRVRIGLHLYSSTELMRNKKSDHFVLEFTDEFAGSSSFWPKSNFCLKIGHRSSKFWIWIESGKLNCELHCITNSTKSISALPKLFKDPHQCSLWKQLFVVLVHSKPAATQSSARHTEHRAACYQGDLAKLLPKLRTSHVQPTRNLHVQTFRINTVVTELPWFSLSTTLSSPC